MATPRGNSVPLTGVTHIDGLTQGSRWVSPGSATNITFSIWNTSFGTWTEAGIVALGTALKQWQNVSNIQFEFLPEEQLHSKAFSFLPAQPVNNNSDLSFIPTGDAINTIEGTTSILAAAIFPDPALAALQVASLGKSTFSWPSAEGDVLIENFQTAFSNVGLGSTGYFAFLHEIGHALGLKHPHDNGGNSHPTFAALGIASLDNQLYSVMSYNPSPMASLNFNNAATPMVLDIAAIQRIYGANMNYQTGNDVYTLVDNNIVETLWDAGGLDTFDASTITSQATIDLQQGAFSLVGGTIGAIALGTIIENAIGSIGSDTITGNEVGNSLRGLQGNDVITALAGNDILHGEDGNDWLQGNQGNDQVFGGTGNDTMQGGKDSDFLQGNQGSDEINGNNSNDTVFGGKDSDTVRGGKDDDFVNGNNSNDMVFGDLGNDTVRGGKDNDIVFGGDGNDLLFGDLGNDTLNGGAGADTFSFNANSGEDVVQDFQQGVDKLQISSSIFAVAGNAITAFNNGILDFGGGNTVTLTGIAAITESDVAIV